MNLPKIKIGFEFELVAPFSSFAAKKRLKESHNINFSGKNKWNIGWDGSIKNRAREHFAHEIITPPAIAQNAIKNLYNILNWMIDNKCKTNYSTGLHINMSFLGPERNKMIDPIKLILFTPCDDILLQYKRQRNIYCSSYNQDFRRWSRSFKTEQVTTWYEASQVLKKRLRTSCNSKNRAISFHFNPHNPYVEFRMVGNKLYETRYSEIKENIEQMIECMHISTDRKAFQIEYQQAISEYM